MNINIINKYNSAGRDKDRKSGRSSKNIVMGMIESKVIG